MNALPRHTVKLWHIIVLWLLYVGVGYVLLLLKFIEPRIFISTANGASGLMILITVFTYIYTWRRNK